MVTPIKKSIGRVRKQEPESEPTLNQLVPNEKTAQSKENATNETLDLKLEFITECESIELLFGAKYGM